MEKTHKCPYCKQKHILEQDGVSICLTCGFQTMKDYIKNSDRMKLMIKTAPKIIQSLMVYDEQLKQYWMPSILNIPNIGLVFPEGNNKEWKWAFAPNIVIAPFDRINYPIPNKKDEYYETRISFEKVEYFDKFEFKEIAKRVGYIE